MRSRYSLLGLLFVGLILLTPREVADASALAQPPSAARMVIFNAIDGSNLTATPVTVNLASLGQPQGSTTRSILIANDSPADPTGNSDLLADLSGATANTTPTSGIAGGTTLRIPPNKEYNLDGQFSTLSLRSKLTAIPIRVYVSY